MPLTLCASVRRTLSWVVVAVVLITLPDVPARAQDSKSPSLAKALTQALDARKLDGIAVTDPGVPGGFFAALYIPGTQLLVVSAKYAAPTLLTDRLSKREYRDVYIDLSSASVAGTKIFVQDQGANGLVAKPGGDDIADSWEEGGKTVAFDGEWKKAKMTEADYLKTFADTDERYARILAALLDEAKK